MSLRFEVWSRTEDGDVVKHGDAVGMTFEDACKQLACDSVDFWTHYEKRRYRNRTLHPSRGEALGNAPPTGKNAKD